MTTPHGRIVYTDHTGRDRIYGSLRGKGRAYFEEMRQARTYISNAYSGHEGHDAIVESVRVVPLPDRKNVEIAIAETEKTP